MLSVVAPIYNEQELVEEFVDRTRAAVADFEYELVLVNDGSSDGSAEILDRIARSDPRVRVIHLSRNFGHQAALTAGLEHAAGDAVAMIDADLQDPPELIPDMVAQWSQGADVVYAVRQQREGETAFKLATARWFYKLFDKLAQVDLEPNSGDFRLLDRRALDALLTMTERSRFLRGMTVWVGFNQTAVSYERDARAAGETKYTVRRMLRFSLDAITSFSHLPLQLATYAGMLSAGVAFIAIPVVVLLRVLGSYLPGFGSITIAILLLGGIQLIALGLIGEYVGRIYDEVKHRPLYIVREELNRPVRGLPGARSRRRPRRAAGPDPRADRLSRRERARAGPGAGRDPMRAATAPPPGSACSGSHMDPGFPCSARRALTRGVLLAALLRTCGLPWCARPVPRRRPAAPASGQAACPYSSVAVIGQRAEGVLRFPEAVAVDGEGNVYVADQLSYVVQKFSAAGAFLGEWGSYGGGPGQFGPIGALAVDAAGNVYVVDSSHDRVEKFAPSGAFITAWGHRGSGLGEFHFGSSQNPTQPPGGGIAVAGSHVFVADTLNNRIERFNLEGGEAMQWGSRGGAPGQFADPRGVAASESEVVVADDDNHRIQKFSPEGAWEGEAGEPGRGPGQFNFPYGVALDAAGDVFVADNINARVVKLSPSLAFLGAWGGPGSKPGQLAFPRGIAADPAGDTYVTDTANGRIEVFDPDGNLLRTIGTSGRGPGQLVAPEGLAARSHRVAVRVRHRGQPPRAVLPGGRPTSASGAAPAVTSAPSTPRRASPWTPGEPCTWPTAATDV